MQHKPNRFRALTTFVQCKCVAYLICQRDILPFLTAIQIAYDHRFCDLISRIPSCLMCTIEWLHVLMRNIKIKWKIISEMKHEKRVKMNNYDRCRHVKTSLWIISKWNSLFHINKYIRTVCHWNWAMKILLAASDMFVCFQFTVQFDCNRKCKRIKICKIPKITYCIMDYRLFSKMMSSARSNGSWMSIFFSKN